MPLIVTLGEALIDFVADVAGVTLAECPGFRKAPGGAPANVAVGVARLGGEAAFVGKVGDDPFGRFLVATLAAAGVDTRGIRYDSEARTGLAFVSLTATGERDFVFYRHPSADMRLRPEELPATLIDSCAVCHFGSISLIAEPCRSAHLAAAERARVAGARITYDPNLRPPLWPSLAHARSAILDFLPQAHWVKVSEEEAEFLLGPGSPPAWAEALLARGPELVCITLGASGCYLATPHASASVPGFAVDVVDTTGAGDAFVAALLVQGATEAPLDDAEWLTAAGRFACAAGALTCTRKGAIPALPRRDEVVALLARGNESPPSSRHTG